MDSPSRDEEPQEGSAQDANAAADPTTSGGNTKTTGRKRTPTAAAVAANEQAQQAAPGKGKPRTRKKSSDTTGVSRTTHGGVKIGGRAVTWVGGAGMPREMLDKMGIPQLRALFLKTFNHPTGSNNAEWLRKKLSQPQDPQVGAARAAVPRARDVSAEIWTTGTTFKGFTKQERLKLQQMGGNCAAKVVEVIRDAPDTESSVEKPVGKRRKKSAETPRVQIIGAQQFDMPPPKRPRASDGVMGDPHSLDDVFDCVPTSGALGGMAGGHDGYGDGDGFALPVASGALMQQPQHQLPWQNLQMSDAHLLHQGTNVKVYRADERWHHGVLENIVCHGTPPHQQVIVTIYYWEHDQAEERPLSEFFRGDSNSLIQWQPQPQSLTAMPMPGVPLQGLPFQGVPMQGMSQMHGGDAMFAHVPTSEHAGMVSAAPMLGEGTMRIQT